MNRIASRFFLQCRLRATPPLLPSKLSHPASGVASFQRRNCVLAHTMSPSIETRAPESFGNFDLVKRVDLNLANIVASKWRSRVSGLSVVHLDYEAPLVNGYFVVATEIFNDSGCPHTLEHLVFMGSEKYPYKGIIDHFANRGFSNGTNAWTDTDHTAYTIATAGDQGFLQLLPIYIDHILYPTITDAGFVTEVHHIDPKGQDSGVVYSEMQGRENSSSDLMCLRLGRLLNKPGSAYRSETGGLMEALRVLTADQIRDYHRKYYVPHNLSLIIAGKLTGGTNSLLSVLQEKVEPSIVEHGQNVGIHPPGWRRPFVETPSRMRDLTENLQETITFPERDESIGELIIAYLGPPPSDFLERKALDILSTYLTASPVAPLNKEFIEIESPLCTYIYFSEDTRASKVDLCVYIGSVPVEHIYKFDEKLKASLKRISEQGFDMERMAMVIRRDERQIRSRIESSKGDAFSGTIIADFLYGAEDGSEMRAALDEISAYSVLQGWSSRQWAGLLKKYYLDRPSVVVRGKPSANMVDKLEKDEKARIETQVKELGSEGLARLGKVLEDAKAEHDRPIPQEILAAFPVPDVKTITWISVQSKQEPGKGRMQVARTSENDLSKHISQDGEELPFFVQYDHVQSNFVTVNAFFSLSDLPNRLRPYVSTYLSSFFSLPVRTISGERLTHEQVVNKLDDETVAYDSELGAHATFEETMRVSIKVETAQYETAIVWLRDLLYGSEFDRERLQVTLAKIQQSLPEMKRDAKSVLGSTISSLLFDETSTTRALGVLAQSDIIPTLLQDLQDEPEKVIASFEEIRKAVVRPSGIRFSVTGNVLGIPKPRSTWFKYFGNLGESPLSPMPYSSGSLSTVGKNPAKKAIVVRLPTIESSFTSHTTRGIQGFTHPDYPAMRVTLEVLNATEGFLWRYIRGSGLAYGAYMLNDREAGLLSFKLYRSSNYIAAFEQAATVVRGLVDGSIALDDTTLDAAKSSIVFSIASEVSTPGRAALSSFENQALKGVPQNHTVDLLKKFQAVTKADVMKTLEKYCLKLFDPAASIGVAVTAPGKWDEIADSLKQKGFDVEKRVIEVKDDEDSESDSESESGSDESR